jgi:hypothetical protein
MAPALGKRPREVGVHTTGNACVHGVGWGGYNCKECPGKGICEHGRRRNGCKECGGSGICEHGRRRSTSKECRAARDAAAPALHPPVHPSILIEFEDIKDPGEEDERVS